MKALTFALTLACLLLVSCSRNPDDVPNPHDSKFETVTLASDTCVLDTETNLLWQTKTTEPGLHNAANTYSWHYVQAVNAAGYCGYNDWRMPNKDELYSVSDIRRASSPPTINTRFFPNARAAEYWSGNDYSFQYDTAWAWNFELGHDRVDWKKEAKYIRRVRGTAGELESVKE